MAHLVGGRPIIEALMASSVRLPVLLGHQSSRASYQSRYLSLARRGLVPSLQLRQFSVNAKLLAGDSKPVPPTTQISSTSPSPAASKTSAINRTLMDLFPGSPSRKRSNASRQTLRAMASPTGVLQDNSYRLPEPLLVKPGPALGRTIPVTQSVDVHRAFERIGGVVGREKIKQQLMQQRFHERPGLKRKRLKSQRWRKKFKNGFYELLTKVREMKRHGW